MTPKPYPYVYSVGREYHVVVDQYLKGEGPTKAVISQFEGIFEVAEAEPAIRDNPAIRKPDPNIVAMALNQTYLFFLRSPESNPRVLVPAIEPYRFKFTDGQAFPEGTFVESADNFSVRDKQELLSEVLGAIRQ